MSTDAKPPTTADLLTTLIEEIRGLRADIRMNGTLPDMKIGRAKMRDWHGPSFEGKCASDCPSEFLLEYAGFLDWKAAQNASDEDKRKYVEADKRNAILARRWATVNKHVRATEKTEAAPDTQNSQRAPAQSGTTPKGWTTGPTWGQSGMKASGQ